MSDAYLSGPEFDLPPFEGNPKTTYMICSTGRSGSTLLCDLLTKTGLLGVPHEYFNLPKHGQSLIRRLNSTGKQRITPDEYLDAIVRHRTSPNGVFGIKAHINQCLPHFTNGLIARHFGEIRYIRIRRHDLVAQAVSLVIADQTGQWTSHEDADSEPEYSREAIENAITVTLYHEFLWDEFFSVNNLMPCCVYYEDLLKDPESEVQKVTDFLGLEIEAKGDLSEPGLRKQTTALNQEWKERFQSGLLIDSGLT